MRSLISITFALFLLLALPACSTSSKEVVNNGPLTPFPEANTDPSNAALLDSVKIFLAENGAPISSRYEFSRLDLDDDGRRDALVLFKNPYGYWCDKHGCTMLVMKAGNDTFELVNAIQPIRPPLYVSEIETNGWRDLIIRVSGRWNESKDVAMQFDGKNYPVHPDRLPPYLRFASNEGTQIFP